MTKKVYKQFFCSVITKNSNWEILTKNLVRMGLRMVNFNILEVHWKIWFLGGRFTKNQYIRGWPKKRGSWTVYRYKGGLGKKEGGGGVIEGGWYANAHYAFIIEVDSEIKTSIWDFVYVSNIIIIIIIGCFIRYTLKVKCNLHFCAALLPFSVCIGF